MVRDFIFQPQRLFMKFTFIFLFVVFLSACSNAQVSDDTARNGRGNTRHKELRGLQTFCY